MSAADPGRALPRGPHGLSREAVELSQRARLLQATTEAVAELGYVKTTVADILTRAGVSRATFYQLFRGKEDIFLAAYKNNADFVAAVMGMQLEQLKAAGADLDPLERLSQILDVYLTALRVAPALARVFLVEVYAAGPTAIEQRRASLEQFVDIVAETHRGETGVLGTKPSQRFAAQAFVGAVSSLVTNAVGVGETDDLPSLKEPLMKLAAQITKKS
jgi:AcrR family transcriptional regulator